VLVGVGAFWDVRQRRIPNALVIVGLVLGLGWQTWGGAGLVMGLAGAATGLGLLIVPFALNMLGGGDVKLAMVVGAFAQPAGVCAILLVTALLTGVISAVFWFTVRFRPVESPPNIPVAVPLAAATFLLTGPFL